MDHSGTKIQTVDSPVKMPTPIRGSGRLMVVEDEPSMAQLLSEALTEFGYEVVVFTDSREALRRGGEGFSALVVDVMMPRLNGFELVKGLRESGDQVPVLFLTARDRDEDIVAGLRIGGDDYLVKPFKLEVLVARLEALIRRSRPGQNLLILGDLELDIRTRRAHRKGRALGLSNTEFALLQFLVERSGQVIAKALLLREIWEDSGMRDDNVVEVYVNYLRGKLEAMGGSRLIHTVRGRGYVLEDRGT
jgi:DNA-binding response OmpR family regulator